MQKAHREASGRQQHVHLGGGGTSTRLWKLQTLGFYNW